MMLVVLERVGCGVMGRDGLVGLAGLFRKRKENTKNVEGI